MPHGGSRTAAGRHSGRPCVLEFRVTLHCRSGLSILRSSRYCGGRAGRDVVSRDTGRAGHRACRGRQSRRPYETLVIGEKVPGSSHTEYTGITEKRQITLLCVPCDLCERHIFGSGGGEISTCPFLGKGGSGGGLKGITSTPVLRSVLHRFLTTIALAAAVSEVGSPGPGGYSIIPVFLGVMLILCLVLDSLMCKKEVRK